MDSILTKPLDAPSKEGREKKKHAADVFIAYAFGEHAVVLAEQKGVLKELREAYSRMKPAERTELFAALQADAEVTPFSEEAATALFETVLSTIDPKAFFGRFLETQFPALHQAIKGPGDIRARVSPEDLPWKVYRKYLLRRRAMDVRQEEERVQQNKETTFLARFLEELKRDIAKKGELPIEVSERKELVLDFALLQSLRAGRRMNEGSNGVIYKIDVGDLPVSERGIVMESGLFPVEDTSAIKILKVYSTEAGHIETVNQRKAALFLKEARAQGKNVARVPEAHLDHVIAFETPELQEAFRRVLKIDSIGAKVNCIAMEYIEGEDLATHIWRAYARAFVRKVVKSDPGQSTGITEEELEYLEKPSTFNEIRNYVTTLERRANILPELRSLLLEEVRPGHTQAALVKERMAHDRNAKRMSGLLLQDGFTIDPDLFDKISNSMDVFRENGLVYLDGHERNIMLRSDGEVFVIDFEKCKWLNRPVRGDGDEEAFTEPLMNPHGEPLDKRMLQFLQQFLPGKRIAATQSVAARRGMKSE
ncbi:hypothetical protein KBA73_00745 [Patescibacteria group bacterium]|nr:hypothetical protein [Patescibacteria group bacterium]